MCKILHLRLTLLLLLYRTAEKSSARSVTMGRKYDLIELEETGERTKLIINPRNPRSYNFTHQGPIAYKSTDFLQLVTHGHLTIDKTLLIKHVVLNQADTIFITCPRKWGKTTNLRMIEKYLDRKVEQDNYEPSREETSNYQFFQMGKLLDERYLSGKFLISKYVEISEVYLSQWAVVYIDFSCMAAKDNISFRNELIRIIQMSYEKFQDVVLEHFYEEGAAMRECESRGFIIDPASFELAQNGDYMEDIFKYCRHSKLSDKFVIKSLYLLTKLLHHYYGKEVFVLVDGYDSPLYVALMDPDFEENDRITAFDLYKKTLGKLLIGNKHVKKSVLTGTFRFKEDGLFPKMKNFVAYNFLKDSIFYYYGINQVDLESICKYMNISLETKLEIQRWYNGFAAGDHLESPIKISNLGSVARYLSHKRFVCYWKEYLMNWEKLLRELTKTTEFFLEISHLMRGEKTRIRTSDITFSAEDLKTITRIKGKSSDDPTLGVELAMKFLLVAGYLVPTNGPCDMCLYLHIPNVEMRYVLGNLLELVSNRRVSAFHKCGLNNETVPSLQRETESTVRESTVSG